MIYSRVIIVGGGPAGAACAWKMRENGMDCRILDKARFPRPKLCAGWINPRVFRDLKVDALDYPGNIRELSRFKIHLKNRMVTVKGHQYAIRRVEFDHWLLKRSGVVLDVHEVKRITRD